ncbi:hypothetical protein [Mucilaginibacter auburnensis]|uniref:Uncharacterized protein n=1 Tax=Mucilaginibacter auburnensis TaxID=1457233 RepID=A0A2H9VQX4_9SPHI|nr:hypothetical protein [Mucilaginibacter auburnensis]PJJ83221.1 hypothetical protein CLV57_0199 [Mucilaginibacter auburnensis]
MKIKQYIESGVLEAFVLGVATDDEMQELTRMKQQHPEVSAALAELESDMERIAEYMAVTPPPDMLTRIENSINDLVITPDTAIARPDYRHNDFREERKSPYIEVEAESNYMRVHKNWKLVFAVVFILSKIFLACTIYFYLESRQAKQQLQETKAELKELKK